jgi:hypothetical protein
MWVDHKITVWFLPIGKHRLIAERASVGSGVKY